MGGIININRWLAGGVAAGALVWLLEGAASVLYMEDMQAAMAEHGLTVETGAWMFAISVFTSLVLGLVMVFFYAVSRATLGQGPRAALVVAVALWLGGYGLSLLGYWMFGLFPAAMLATWAVVGLVEMCLASLLGAWIYREASS